MTTLTECVASGQHSLFLRSGTYHTHNDFDLEQAVRIEVRARTISNRGIDLPEARAISERVEQDPTGPEGIYGFGRCDRCGESFREDDEQAEVAGTHESPSRYILDNVVIHVGCITDTDVLA